VRLGLLTRFATLSFLCIGALAVAMGFALSFLLTRAVSEWEWENTAALIRREMELEGLDALFAEAPGPETRERWSGRVTRLFAGLPEVVRVKVWDRTGTVIWSDEAQLVGQRFPDNEELREALAGKIAVEIKRLDKAEQRYERAGFATLAEVYVPIFAKGSREVRGVIEVYKTPDRLLRTIRQGQIVTWGISVLGGLALYLVILPLTRQVYGREVREEALRADAERLEAEVTQRTQELTRRTEQLFQARKMEAIGLLAGGVAHDFNNLLTVILGRSGLLRSRIGSEDPLRRHVDLIEETSKRASALTRQLLAFSRRQPFHARLVDLNAVVRDMEPMLRRLIGEDVRLQTTLLATPAWVRADQSQLEQVVLNLVVNARDAMPRGGHLTLATRTAEVDAAFVDRHPGARVGRYAVLDVTDTGEGMDATIRSRVFEPFFTTKEPGKGTGLGLATVYGIVKQSDGNVWVRSEPGHGTTFEVYLPLAERGPEEEKPSQPEPATLPRGSETILLVEDEEAVGDLALEILRGQGYTVLSARHGAEALLTAEQHAGPIQLLLTDVVMPGMSGTELAERLSTFRPGIRVLFTSGYAGARATHAGHTVASADLLQKPFTPETLARRVRQALDTG
jgi:signal transduction histidine kinase/CheY-like chemotaxis protein